MNKRVKMPFSQQNRAGTLSGIIFVAIFAAAATYIADIGAIKALGLSPLVIGIVMGIFYANTLHNKTPSTWQSGITFSGKKNPSFCHCTVWLQNYLPADR